MGTALEDDRQGTRTPSVRLRNVGDWVDVAIIYLDDKCPMKEYGTNEVMIGQNGKPRTQQLVVGKVLASEGAVIGDEDGDDIDVPEGEIVAIYLSGHNRWNGSDDPTPGTTGQPWINARDIFRKATKRGLQTGDVLRWMFEGEEPSSRATNNNKKLRFCTLYPADDEAVVEECDRLHAEYKAERAGRRGSPLEQQEEEPFPSQPKRTPPTRTAPPPRERPANPLA